MTREDFAWALGRIYMGVPAVLVTRGRSYGRENVPAAGGVVLAINHLHWIDIPLVGAFCPRSVWYVAKAEATGYPALGRFLRWHGAIGVRRGESDRDAVRKMRTAAAAGNVVGLFVEGTRQKHGRPGAAQPGAAMVALQEHVPVVPVAVFGTNEWRIGNFRRCSVAFGEPLTFDGLPKGGRGYKEATVEIERRINVLFDWLSELDGRGRPRGLTPPV